MTLKKSISLLIVDDNHRFRNHLKTLIHLYSQNNLAKLNLIGDADSVIRGKSILDKHQPQVLILDLELNRESGLEILQYLTQQNYQSKALILSAHQEEDTIFKAMSLGAKGYVFKPNVVTQFLEAINTIINEKVYLPPEVATGFFSSFERYADQFDSQKTNLDSPKYDYHLTQREQEVLSCLVEGFSNEEIAEQLFVTIATVKAHLGSIFSKFGVKNRNQAIIMAIKKQLV